MMNAITNSKSEFYREAMTVYCRVKPRGFFAEGLRGNVSFLVRVIREIRAKKRKSGIVPTPPHYITHGG
jgi:hypothetical protein